MTGDYDIAPPAAGAMIESLRAYGYTLETAIADLIDNSIAAGAKNVWLNPEWNGDGSWISILDDGIGMDEPTLVQAMRPGSQSPRQERAADDLGRFGLGLKTASFSQCRSLTVAAKTVGAPIAIRRWDLDYVSRKDEWRLLKSCRRGSEEKLAVLNTKNQGTLVLLENLDRIAGNTTVDNKKDKSRFFENIDHLRAHLAMVFHRYLDGTSPRVRILIDGTDESSMIIPWSPFGARHPATQPQPEEHLTMPDGHIPVQGFILPHKDRMTEKDYAAMAGPTGWNEQQGFYVYRNRRLLVAGSWLGLGQAGRRWTREEHYKLARIRIDLPNTMDEVFQIDVRKSKAILPSQIRGALTEYAAQVRETARGIFAHRGRYGNRGPAPDIARVWKTVSQGGSRKYLIDRRHLALRSLLETPRITRKNVETALRIIEESVPVEQIWIDTSEHPENTGAPFSSVPENDVIELADTVFKQYQDGGMTEHDAAEAVCRMDVFLDFQEIIRAYLNAGGE
jgi:hypothetical protein